MKTESVTDILYISSVPVTEMFSGATFMYRLFEGLEKRLIIFQGIKLNPGSQLKNTQYHYHEPIFKRLHLSRFKQLYELLNIVRNYFFIPREITKNIKHNKPKAIVTVSNGLLWILAYRVARKHNIPLVLLAHDDINSYFRKGSPAGKIIQSLFCKVYRGARLRFCISELMKEKFQERYQVSAEVLHPLQGDQSGFYKEIKNSSDRKIIIAYAGSLDSGPYTRMILSLADALKKNNDTLMIFSNVFPEELKAAGNIVNRGFMEPSALQRELQSADALFVPFPFYNSTLNIDLAFPSKMADYTAAGRPLLIWAPPDCALSQWTRSLPVQIGLLVESENAKAIRDAVVELREKLDSESWGENSFRMGQQYFGKRKQQLFFLSKIEEVITGQ